MGVCAVTVWAVVGCSPETWGESTLFFNTTCPMEQLHEDEKVEGYFCLHNFGLRWTVHSSFAPASEAG